MYNNIIITRLVKKEMFTVTEMEAILERHSVRSYQDKKIEKEKIEKLNALISECNEKGGIFSKVDKGIVKYHFEAGAGQH